MLWGRHMNSARDKYSNKLVGADRASPVPDRYVCPRCGAPVSLRRGQHRVANFAHLPGTGSPECELYYPSEYSGYVGTRGADVREPALFVRLFLSDDGLPLWHLELNAPIPAGSTVDVPFAEGGKRTFLGQDVHKREQVPVVPGVSVYRLEVSGGGGGVPDTPGLDRMRPNVFNLNLGSLAGRRLNEHSVMHWNGTYVLITGPEAGLEDVPQAVRHRMLHGNRGWGGQVIQLPSEPSDSVATWIHTTLSQRVELSPASLGLLSPLPLSVASDGTFLLERGRRVIVGVSGDREGARCVLEILGDQQDEPRSYAAEVGRLLDLGPMPEGRFDMAIDGAWDMALSVASFSEPPFALPPSVEVTMQREDGDVEAIPLFSLKLAAYLGEVRSKSATITDVLVPFGVQVRTRWRKPGQRWEEDSLGTPRENGEALRHSIQVLQHVLADPAYTVELEAGPFGQVRVDGAEQDAPSLGRSEPTAVHYWLAAMDPSLGYLIESATSTPGCAPGRVPHDAAFEVHFRSVQLVPPASKGE